MSRELDPDFSVIHLKANASGSWFNVLRCKVEDEQRVKDACLVLQKAAQAKLKFKLVDAVGGELSFLGGAGMNFDRWVEAK